MKLTLGTLFLAFLLVGIHAIAQPDLPEPLFNHAARQDYYIFVLGCIKTPGNLIPCQNDPTWDWKDWLARLRDHLGFGAAHQLDFDAWMQTHVWFLRASDVNSGELANTVESLGSSSGKVWLIGFSAGGAVALNYLEQLRESGRTTLPPIGGAVTVDSPLGDARDLFSWGGGQYIDFDRGGPINGIWPSAPGRFVGLGAWADAHGIALATISYQNDYFNPRYPLGDIPLKTFAANRVYAGPFDLEKNHGYFFRDPNGLDEMFRFLFGEHSSQQ